MMLPGRMLPGDSARRARRRGRSVVLLLAGAAFIAGCFDFTTSPGEIMFLSFERIPFPSVVLGDTLRDSTGAVAALDAVVVNAGGETVTAAPLRFFAIDDTAGALDVDSVSGIVVSEGNKLRTVRVVASLGSLQSVPLPILITKRPDSLHLDVTNDTISYSFTDSTRNFSNALRATVLHNDSTTFYSGVGGWLVRYSLERAEDTVSAALVDDQNRRLRSEPSGLFHIDTTASDGSASRKLRVRPGPPLATPLDSVVVLVEATYRGEHIAGSPGRVVVYVRPLITP